MSKQQILAIIETSQKEFQKLGMWCSGSMVSQEEDEKGGMKEVRCAVGEIRWNIFPIDVFRGFGDHFWADFDKPSYNSRKPSGPRPILTDNNQKLYTDCLVEIAKQLQLENDESLYDIANVKDNIEENTLEKLEEIVTNWNDANDEPDVIELFGRVVERLHMEIAREGAMV